MEEDVTELFHLSVDGGSGQNHIYQSYAVLSRIFTPALPPTRKAPSMERAMDSTTAVGRSPTQPTAAVPQTYYFGAGTSGGFALSLTKNKANSSATIAVITKRDRPMAYL